MEKIEKLEDYVKSLKKAAVAFSSGVDSTFLLYITKKILKDNAAAITVKSSLMPKRELEESMEFCKKFNIKQYFIELDESEIAGFKSNPKERCYLCKSYMFKKIKTFLNEIGYENILEGSNVDDDKDYRPGYRAICELEIKSPLKIFGFTKKQIREYSKKFKLESFDKPSFACLASRIPSGEEITKEKLKMIEESEDFLYALGFKQFRVRIHGQKTARIEVLPNEIEKAVKLRKQISEKLKENGFKFVSLDLEGYKTGNMNKIL